MITIQHKSVLVFYPQNSCQIIESDLHCMESFFTGFNLFQNGNSYRGDLGINKLIEVRFGLYIKAKFELVKFNPKPHELILYRNEPLYVYASLNRDYLILGDGDGRTKSIASLTKIMFGKYFYLFKCNYRYDADEFLYE